MKINRAVRIIGFDPGLRNAGWGVIDSEGNRISHVADGVVKADPDRPLAERLLFIHTELSRIVGEFRPGEAAIEETLVNKDARATLKLGQARGVTMLVPAALGITVWEYAPNLVKKSVTGSGHAEKNQILHMIRILLPAARPASADAADALAIAICHAHHRGRTALLQGECS